jgi:glycine cleavage system regulatory protein
MEMRVLLFSGEAYCDSDRQDELVRRTLAAIEESGAALEASELSVDRGSAMFLVSGSAAAIRRLWAAVEATGLENAWEAFGARLDWQTFEMSR